MKVILIPALVLFFPTLALATQGDDGLAAFKHYHFQEALRLLQPLAEKGEPVSQYKVGLLYEQGWGVKQDFVEGMKWLQRSAEQGCSGAQYQVGYMYENGLGTSRNHDEASKWYDKSNADTNQLAGCEYMEPPVYVHALPKDGVIPNAGVAVEVAEAILKAHFGKEKILKEEPFTALLLGDTWIISGHLPEGRMGGVASMRLSKSKGCVIDIAHGM
jgi:hypothetical protein